MSNLSKANMLCGRHLASEDTFYRNLRCPLWTSLTVSIKLIFDIFKKLSYYLQIPGCSLYLITTMINIIIFRKLDNKILDFIIQWMVHDLKLFFFNLMNDIIYPISDGYIFFTYFQDVVHNFWWLTCINIQVANIRFWLIPHRSMQWYRGNHRTKWPDFSAIESMIWCFQYIFANFFEQYQLCWNWLEISISCLDKTIIWTFFMFIVVVFLMSLLQYFTLSITITTYYSLGKFGMNLFSNQYSNTLQFISFW